MFHACYPVRYFLIYVKDVGVKSLFPYRIGHSSDELRTRESGKGSEGQLEGRRWRASKMRRGGRGDRQRSRERDKENERR